MNVFTIIALVILAFGLIKDYKRDDRQNIKAKIFHAICLIIICTSYAGSFGILGALLRNFDKSRQTFSSDVGFVSGQIHFILFLAHLALSLIVLILAFQMINRNEKARRLFIKFLPFLALTEIFSFYRGWVADGDDLGMNHSIIILIGFLFIGGLTVGIIGIYISRFMKIFFNAELKTQPFDSTDILDTNIGNNKIDEEK